MTNYFFFNNQANLRRFTFFALALITVGLTGAGATIPGKSARHGDQNLSRRYRRFSASWS